jgi:hypothetical protein
LKEIKKRKYSRVKNTQSMRMGEGKTSLNGMEDSNREEMYSNSDG